ncbi:hypothetical protein DIC82_05670 [Clostridium beijerinckii]|nr:hypothetical protein DIC82_05670 [Clostridium beijerinckii]
MLLIRFFPKIYKDELIYSVIGRHHQYCGNISTKDTLMEFFNTTAIIPTLEFQSHLKEFTENLKNEIDINSNEIIENNTLIPLYSYFMEKEEVDKIKNIIINSDGRAIKYKIGFIAGGICKKEYINYCPLCAKKEIKEYGEIYIHRTHQVQGVLVCENHGCLLESYIVNSRRQEYILLDERNINFNIRYPNKNIAKKLITVARDIYFLLNNNEKYYINDIKNKYNYLLYKRSLVNINGRVNQLELQKQFINFYGTEFIKKLESDIDENNEFNWLRCIVRKYKKTIHPLRHILFINFLCKNAKEFINQMKIEEESDIKRPWLCLNHCCVNYKKAVISDYKIKIDSKSKKIIGTFKCDYCGFTYSRCITGDLEYRGRVKCYGIVWEGKLKELINSNISLHAIAKEMHCDSATVIKYAEKLGMEKLLNTKRKLPLHQYNKKPKIKLELRSIYVNEVQELVSSSPNITRSDIRKKLSKEYIWLYRYDKEWIEKILPRTKRAAHIKDYSEYWRNKDKQILVFIKETYSILIKAKKPIRITKSLIGRHIHKEALMEKKLDKLPQSCAFLESICESIEEFRFRRLDKIYANLNEERIEMPDWKILKIAGLKDKAILEKYNNEYNKK